MEFIITSFESVGEIKFGMTKDKVIELFGKEPDSESIGWTKKTNMYYDNINIILNKKGLVDEITFTEGNNEIVFEGKNLYKESDIIKKLSKIEKPIKSSGDVLFLESGIGFLQFKYKEERAITAFSKEVGKQYKKLCENK